MIERIEKIMDATGRDGKQAILPRESSTHEYVGDSFRGKVRIPLIINQTKIISCRGDSTPPVIALRIWVWFSSCITANFLCLFTSAFDHFLLKDVFCCLIIALFILHFVFCFLHFVVCLFIWSSVSSEIQRTHVDQNIWYFQIWSKSRTLISVFYSFFAVVIRNVIIIRNIFIYCPLIL